MEDKGFLLLLNEVSLALREKEFSMKDELFVENEEMNELMKNISESLLVDFASAEPLVNELESKFAKHLDALLGEEIKTLVLNVGQSLKERSEIFSKKVLIRGIEKGDVNFYLAWHMKHLNQDDAITYLHSLLYASSKEQWAKWKEVLVKNSNFENYVKLCPALNGEGRLMTR